MKKRKEVIPLFPLKHDFYESLDRVLEEALSLRLAVKSALDLNLVKGAAEKLLRERLDVLDEVMEGK